MNNPMDISRLYGLNSTDNPRNNPAKYMPSNNMHNETPVKTVNELQIKNNTDNSNVENIGKNNNDPNASTVIKILSNNKTMADSKNSEMETTIQKSCCTKHNLDAVPYPLRNQTDNVMYHDPNSPYPVQSRNRERLIKANATDIKSEYSSTNTSPTPYSNMQNNMSWENNNSMNNMNSTTEISDIPNMNNATNMMNMTDMTNMAMSTTENTFPQQYRVTPQSMQCMNGFLRSQTGKIAEVEFIVDGTTRVKQGYLTAIGDNYILITEIDTGKLIVCDHSDLKFVTLYN